MMLRQGRRPGPFDRHEQLSVKPLSSKPPPPPSSSLTSPCSSNKSKKKLLKVILNIPPPNPNPNSVSVSIPNPNSIPSPSPPPTPSSSSSSPASPLHHHSHLQLHQLHQHQQLLQQHYQKQKLLQQQTQQLASELQFKLQQQHLQHLQLQQHHPELLEQFKQHLGLQQLSDPARLAPELVRSLAKPDGDGNPKFEEQDGLDSPGSQQDEEQENPKGLRRPRSRIPQEILLDERRQPKRVRIHGEEEEFEGSDDHGASVRLSNCRNSESRPSHGFQSRPLGELGAPKPSNSVIRDVAGAIKMQQGAMAVHKPVSEDKGPANSTPNMVHSRTMVISECSAPAGKKMLKGVLDELQKKDRFGVFAEPVDPEEVPNYYDIIKEPMDFGTMRKKITAGYYTNLDLFEKDIFKICSNAMTFNAAGTIYYKQARAIKVAAERALQALKLKHAAEGMAGEAANKNKSTVKKSHKKKSMLRTLVDNPKVDYASEDVVDCGGRLPSGQPNAYGRRLDCQADSVHTHSKNITDNRDDFSGFLAKSAGFNDGRRLQSVDENRRGTFKPTGPQGSSPLLFPTAGIPLHFVPAAYQIQFSYARSLARFAADLGPAVWKVAANKIRRALPPGVPFGPGWVGEPETPGGSLSPANKPQRPLPHDVRAREGALSGDGRMPTCLDSASKVRDSPMSVDSHSLVDSRSSNLEQHDSSSIPAQNNLDIRHQQTSNMSQFSQSCTQKFPGRMREEMECFPHGTSGDLRQYASNNMDLQPPEPELPGLPPVGSNLVLPGLNNAVKTQGCGTSEGQELVMVKVSGIPEENLTTASLHQNKYLGPPGNVKLIQT